MKKIILSISIVLLLVLILNLAIAQQVQTPGFCCCTPTTGTFSQTNCPQGQRELPADISTNCES